MERKLKQIKIKNQAHYHYNDIISLKKIESKFLEINKKHIAIERINDWENIYSVNSFYLLVNHVSGYIKEKNGNKDLIFDNSVNENKELLKKYADIWDGIKNEIKTINGGKEDDYGKDYIKIRFNSDDDLPLSKPLKFSIMSVVVRHVFKEDGKLYPQFLLDAALCNEV